MKKNKLKIAIFYTCYFVFSFSGMYAQEILKQDTTRFNKSNSSFEAGGEYLTPTRFSDKIQTTSLYAFFWKRHLKNISVKINSGITTTYAWGYTTLQKRISESEIQSVNYKTSAFGLGPAFQVEYAPIIIKRFSVVVEASSGIILYSRRFPYGGDIYNFMFRTGPSITYKIKSNYFFKMGYRWMHVSNGKGSGPQNPYYEAQGLNISFIIVK